MIMLSPFPRRGRHEALLFHLQQSERDEGGKQQFIRAPLLAPELTASLILDATIDISVRFTTNPAGAESSYNCSKWIAQESVVPYLPARNFVRCFCVISVSDQPPRSKRWT